MYLESSVTHNDDSGTAWWTSWSPISPLIAIAGMPPGGLQVLDAESGEVEAEATVDVLHSCVDWDPSGRRLVAGNSDGGITRIDAQTGTPEIAAQIHGDEVRCVAYSPDAEFIASGGNDSRLVVCRSDDLSVVASIEAHPPCVRSVHWSRGGNHLVTAGHDGVVRVWETNSWEPAGALADHEGFVTRAAFSPNDRYLASSSLDSTLRVWDMMAQKYQIVVAEFEGWWVTGFDFSPDGEHIIAIDQEATLRCIRLADGMVIAKHTVRRGSTNVRWSPNGNCVSVGGRLEMQVLRVHA